MNQPLLSVKDLKTYFPTKKIFFNKERQVIKAVDGINFQVNKGETLGIVGESGCGKSTMGRSILRLIEPTEGSIKFEGKEVTTLNQKDLRKLRSNMQIVFQDPFASLNPKMTVGSILGEALATHQLGQSSKERKEKVKELLGKVGLSPIHIERYPHEFSGGQRQRIGIARAIAVNPALIIADEPVSALDVSVQAQILNLFQDLKETLGLTYIFIAHDLSVVKHVSDRIGVMYLGKIVELSDKKQLFQNPLHPYTQALISAVPTLDPDAKKDRIILSGDVPSPSSPPSGCAFHTRCMYRKNVCENVKPREITVSPGRLVNCHMYDEDYFVEFL
ncbi:ABC transporter ATP-binding protein [Psychrobacillus vulpis]|uniref:Dipeptide ABC transporter ATP-binding protein n=1 Tax=Psychrobacillus vulpis TaxID=2325572 RepID=A0A544TUY7_9BACI|nr:dipeptide ABC transporter ATP-binding protein [Psychrobacillus vulpis]TQR21252.1 dipeptide ABC transporter ATP-binding protein [Psychrobacillus vulpis]